VFWLAHEGFFKCIYVWLLMTGDLGGPKGVQCTEEKTNGLKWTFLAGCQQMGLSWHDYGGREQQIHTWTAREASGSFPQCPTQVCSQHGRGQSPRPRRDFCSASCIPCSCHITCEVNRNSILAWRSHLGPSSPARAGTSDSAACRRGSVAADSQRNSSRVVQTQSPSCMSLQEGQLRNARSHQTN
jgi:hypothetical protein